MKKTLILFFVIMIIPATAQSVQTTLTPSITAKTTYTSNVNRVSDDQNAQDDFVTTISPSISLSALGKTAGLTATYSPSRVFYNELTELKYWRHQATLNGWSQLTKHTNFTIGGSYLQSEDPGDTDFDNLQSTIPGDTDVDNLQVEDPANTNFVDYTDRRGREKYYTYSTNAGLSYQFLERSSISLGAGYGGVENDDPTLEDSHYYRYSLGINYGFLPMWTASLNVAYRKGIFEITDDFDNYTGSVSLAHQINNRMSAYVTYQLTSYLSDLAGDEDEDDRVHDLSVGFDYSIAADLNFSAQIGYFLRKLPDRDDESDAYGKINFTKSYKQGSVGIAAGSGYDYTYFRAENLGFNYYYFANLTGNYEFTQRFSGNAYVGYRRSEYDDDRTRDNYTAGCGISYQILRWLSMGAGYNVRYYKPEDTADDYVDQRVYVSLTASKDYLIWH